MSGVPRDTTSIVLTWNPPPAIDINGILTNYVVEVTEQFTGNVTAPLNTFGDVMEITIGALHPYFEYICRVAAFTTGLTHGPFSNVISVFTAEAGI